MCSYIMDEENVNVRTQWDKVSCECNAEYQPLNQPVGSTPVSCLLGLSFMY